MNDTVRSSSHPETMEKDDMSTANTVKQLAAGLALGAAAGSSTAATYVYVSNADS